MDSSVETLIKDVMSQDRNARYEAYMRLLSITQEKVDRGSEGMARDEE